MSRISDNVSVPPSRKLTKFLILFDNTNLLFFPGQFLTGRVLVELEDETPVLGTFCYTSARQNTNIIGLKIISFGKILFCCLVSMYIGLG
jgi:hypothetical protein